MKWLVRERLSRNHPSRSKGTKSQCCTKDGTIVQLTLLQCRLTKKCSKTSQIIHICNCTFFRLSSTVQKRRNNREWERARVDTNTFDIQNMMNCPIKEKMILYLSAALSMNKRDWVICIILLLLLHVRDHQDNLKESNITSSSIIFEIEEEIHSSQG